MGIYVVFGIIMSGYNYVLCVCDSVYQDPFKDQLTIAEGAFNIKVGCHGPRMRTEIYCSANLTLNLQVDSEYVVA